MTEPREPIDTGSGPMRQDSLAPHAMDHIPAGVLLVDAGNVIRAANAPALRMLGRTAEEVIGASIAAFVHGEDLPAVVAFEGAEGAEEAAVARFIGALGTHAMLVSRAALPAAPRAGATTILTMLPADRLVSEIASLRKDETRWKYALESALEGVWDHDFETGNLFYSSTWRRLRGLADDAEVDGTLEKWIENVHPDDRAHVLACIARQDSGEAKFNTFQYRERHADGRWIWIESRGASVAYGPDGKPCRIIGTDTDITARKEAEARLAEVSRRLQLALDVSRIGVFEHNLDTGVSHWDEAMFRMYGLDPAGEAPSSAGWESFLHPEDKVVAIKRVNDAIASGTPFTNAFRIIRPDGVVRHIRSNAAFHTDLDGATRLVGANWDITDDIALQEELRRAKSFAEARNSELEAARVSIEYNALHDHLTDLPNRRYLDRILTEARVVNAILHIDLDRFKQINDTLGHQAGDAMLVHAADVLRSHAERDDFIARIGGDEFVIVCRSGRGSIHLEELAQGIIQAFRRPVPYAGQLCRLGASIGVAVNEGRLTDPRQLLMDADIALYRAKSLGRDRFEVFSDEMQNRILTAKRIGDELREALEKRQFIPYYQPQFDARSLEITGVETLVRWSHPARGVLAPMQFLKVAEDINLLAAIDRMVVEMAYADFRAWQRQGLAIPKISVNISSRRLRDPQLVSDVREMKIPRGVMSFELLESIFLDEFEDEVAETIAALNELGIDIEIDDFGTGHASIIGLLKLNPARLKIDRALVGPVTENRKQQKLVRAIIDIGHSLNIKVVAEGVETWTHAALLADLGCDVLQGYALAKPMSREDFERLARKGFDVPRSFSEARRVR
ncbi:sensor domain-containing protein [Sinorhizobium terangae]|uniref:sensor domain-containing protein n=1 Tax=Sinorhizobium terangae TaxID=110322 RepID=UPI0024B14D4A|nr:GGDEF and EAL domain-containing protein [Sinorhizobium terangae]WFU49216.1 EAL domain-containing protein [Sinorhizobium terangae]